jgi:BASS family bile acid:Na+ symporter
VSVLNLALQASVMLFMVGSLAGVGLAVTPREALAPLKNLRFVGVSLVAGWVVCPALAYLLLHVVPVERPYATGMLLLALAPCAPFAPTMVRRVGGDVAYAIAFMILCTGATVLVMPLALPLIVDGLSVHPWRLARPLLFFVLGPVVLGMLVRQVYPQLAARARGPLAVLSNAAGVVVVLLVLVLFGRGVVNAVGSYAIATQTLFLGSSAALAHLLAKGLPDNQRSVITIGIWSRNLGAALAPLAAMRSDSKTMVMIAISALVTLLLSPLVSRQLARRRPSAGQVPRAA